MTATADRVSAQNLLRRWGRENGVPRPVDGRSAVEWFRRYLDEALRVVPASSR